MSRKNTHLLLSILVAVLLCLGGSHVIGATLYVPDNAPTIQEAVDMAVDGDTILVRPGTYREHILISAKSLTLKSTDGAGSTIIDGTNSGRPLTLTAPDNFFNVILEGLTIANGFSSYGGGLSVSRGGHDIIDCIFRDNHTTGSGGGAYISGFAGVDFVGCTFAGNRADANGGGAFSSISVVHFINSRLENNTAGLNGGGYVASGFCNTSSMKDSYIIDNTAGTYGGGLYSTGSGSCVAHLTTRNSIIAGNSATYGGGIAVGSYGVGNTSSSTIVFNSALEGGAFYMIPDVYTGTPGVDNNIMYFNETPPVFTMANVTYNDIEGGYPAIGNIDADPQFIDALNGDYRLSAGSPCIDASTLGTNPDIVGTPRPLGDGYDMGAYEFIPAGSDADGDGYYFWQECDDNEPAVNPSAVEVCDEIDNNCDGVIDEGFDSDGDGYAWCSDCNDEDSTMYPGAPEVKHDGLDQDCNGYDLTIDIITADYKSKKDILSVEATSSLGDAADLILDYHSYSVPMNWNDKKNKGMWTLTVDPANGDPGTVTVWGVEGAESAPTSETCSSSEKKFCSDELDNDCDGLFDCHDPDCAKDKLCK